VRARAVAACAFLALLASSCFAGDPVEWSAIGDIIGTSAMIRGEVVNKREADGFAFVTVQLDEAPIDLQAGRANQRSLAKVPGDALELLHSDGNFEVGRTYAFFITDGPEDTFTTYGHDVDSDEPADDFDDNAGWAGQSPLDVLDCLVAAHGNTGPNPRLAAAVQAATESNQAPGANVLSAQLEACEYPKS